MRIYDYCEDIFGEVSLKEIYDIIEIKKCKVFLLGGHHVSVSALPYLYSSLNSLNSLNVLTNKQILKLKKYFVKRNHRFGED